MNTYSKEEISDDMLTFADQIIDGAGEAVLDLEVDDSIKVLRAIVDEASAMRDLDRGKLVAACKIRLRERAK